MIHLPFDTSSKGHSLKLSEFYSPNFSCSNTEEAPFTEDLQCDRGSVQLARDFLIRLQGMRIYPHFTAGKTEAPIA